MGASLIRQYSEWSELRSTLSSYDITLDKISKRSGVAVPTVARVLDVNLFHNCKHSAVVKVQSAITELMPSFATFNFDEYVVGDA